MLINSIRSADIEKCTKNIEKLTFSISPLSNRPEKGISFQKVVILQSVNFSYKYL